MIRTADGTRGKALFGAVVLSFAVYLIPIINVHAAGWMPLGVVWGGIAMPSVFTIAMMLGAVALQALAAAVIYWVFRRRRWLKWLILAGAVPVFGYGANLVFLLVIPMLVLIGPETAAETGDLLRVCSLPDATLAQVHSGTDLGLERAGEAWVILHDGRKRALITMPDCRLVPVTAPKWGSTMDHVAAGGHVLTTENTSGLTYVGPALEAPRGVEKPVGKKYWRPILSDDGKSLAWLDRQPAQTGPRLHRLHLRRLSDGREQTITLDLAPDSKQVELIGAATAGGMFTLARYRNEILAVDGKGRTIRGPISPENVYNAGTGFRWVGEGWVAWDGYREEGRRHVVWSLAAGKGDVALPRGRSIESLAVDPGGAYIAISAETNLRIGSARSSVFLLRTSDGQEVYRRFYPKFARVRLAFLGSDYLAMTRTEDRRGHIDVYRVPPAQKD